MSLWREDRRLERRACLFVLCAALGCATLFGAIVTLIFWMGRTALALLS